MFGALLVTVVIATSSATSISNVSASASGGSSAEASSVVRMQGGSSTVEVRTVVDGVETYERRERGGSEPVTVRVVASTTQASSTAPYALTTESEKAVAKRVLTLVRRILAFFGLSVGDL